MVYPLNTRALALVILMLLVAPSLFLVGGPATGPGAIGEGEATFPTHITAFTALGEGDPGNVTVVGVAYPGELDAFNYSDVLVLINNNSDMSKMVGEYFVTARNIPRENVAILDVPNRERITFPEFDDLVDQVKTFMTDNNMVRKINYIVTTKGFPLKTSYSDYYSQACVDEELAMIFGGYERNMKNNGWVLNPYYGNRTYFSRNDQGIFLVNRLTGYDWPDVKALIDHVDGSYGNRGQFVLDVDPSKGYSTGGYGVGNLWLRNARDILVNRGEDVFFDESRWYVVGKTDVMGYGSWGSNDANDTDRAKPHNTWVNGSIAETFVSTGGRTFTYPPSYGQSMVADIIREGVTGIKGYVYEPFLSAIAHPDILFERYTAGFNLAESYRMASVMIGWMGVVVGDPKCSAYRDIPDLAIDDSSLTAANLTPSTEDPTSLRVSVRNLGGVADNATVDLYIDGQLWVRENVTFDTFSETTIDITFDAPGTVGDHDILVQLNLGPGQFFETLYDNNRAGTSITTIERPEVELRTSIPTVLTFDTLQFEVVILQQTRVMTTFYFDFGDGSPVSSLGSNKTFHSYEQDGVYNVSAWVLDKGMVLSFKSTLVVTVLNRAPSAIIAVEPSEALTWEEFTFNATTSSDLDGEVVTATWDMGDGNTTTGMVVTHMYAMPGDYIVRVTVKDDDDAVSSVTRRVIVLNRPPVADFVREGSTAMKGRSTTFNASTSTDPDGRILQYEWSFGDDSSGDVTTSPWVVHTFSMAGEYTITLTVIDELGGTNTADLTVTVLTLPPEADIRLDLDTVPTGVTVSLAASRSYDPDGDVEGYDFAIILPSGSILEVASGQGPTVTYMPTVDGVHTIIVNVTDDDGWWTEASVDLMVLNRPPIAIWDPATEVLEGTVVLAPRALAMAVEVQDPDGRVESVEWFDGEGEAIATGPLVSLDVADEGPLSFHAIVTDDDGATTDLWLNLTANVAPDTFFNISRNGEGIVGVDVYPEVMLTFDGSLSTDPGAIARYQWSFGDGLTQEGMTIQHAYAMPGTYKATLKVTDDHGETSEHSLDVLVIERPKKEEGISSSWLAIIAIVVVVMVAIALAFVLRSRQSRDEG